MRNLTFGAVALATLIASGVAFAADEPSRNVADAEAEAAAAWQQAPRQPLGYAGSYVAGHPAFVAVVTQEKSPVSEADRLFLKQGDRGIGND